MGFRSSKHYVNGLSPTELGNALYHIAQHTTTAKGYTQEFITNVLLRASEIVYMLKPRHTPTHIERYPEEVRRGLDEAIIHDWTPPETITEEEDVLRTSYEKFIIRQQRSVATSEPPDKSIGFKLGDVSGIPDFTQHWTRNKRKNPE